MAVRIAQRMSFSEGVISDLYLAGLLVGLPAAVLSYVLLKTLVFRQARNS